MGIDRIHCCACDWHCDVVVPALNRRIPGAFQSHGRYVRSNTLTLQTFPLSPEPALLARERSPRHEELLMTMNDRRRNDQQSRTDVRSLTWVAVIGAAAVVIGLIAYGMTGRNTTTTVSPTNTPGQSPGQGGTAKS